MDEFRIRAVPTSPWNKGKLVGRGRRSNSRKFGPNLYDEALR